jgi:hypothetical protein
MAASKKFINLYGVNFKGIQVHRFVRQEPLYYTNRSSLTSIENFIYVSCHLALEGPFLLIELNHRHLKAYTKVILVFGFSWLSNVALKPFKFWNL